MGQKEAQTKRLWDKKEAQPHKLEGYGTKRHKLEGYGTKDAQSEKNLHYSIKYAKIDTNLNHKRHRTIGFLVNEIFYLLRKSPYQCQNTG